MIRDNLPPKLIEDVLLITEKKTREQEKLQAFMKKELDKLGVNSPAELSRQKRKDLFNKVDKAFVSDAEEDGTDVEPEDKETLKKFKKESVHGKNENLDEKALMDADFPPVKGKKLQQMKKLKKGDMVIDLLDPSGKSQIKVESNHPKLETIFYKIPGGGGITGTTRGYRFIKLIGSLDEAAHGKKKINEAKTITMDDAMKLVSKLLDKGQITRREVDTFIKIQFDFSKGKKLNPKQKKKLMGLLKNINTSGGLILKEASDPTTGLDTAEERFFRVEVVHGATGVAAVFMVGATNHRGAEQQALFAARDEPDLRNPPNIGGFQLVVDSSVEITKAEFDAGEVAPPVGPKTGRNIANE